eukprot:gene16815-4969_t
MPPEPPHLKVELEENVEMCVDAEAVLDAAPPDPFPAAMEGGDPTVGDAAATADDPLAPLDKLHNITAIRDRLAELRAEILQWREDNRAGRGQTDPPWAGSWIFLGNPGTGKTTVAKAMGQMLGPPPGLGMLNRSDVVITSAAELTGAVMGEAKNLVQAKMDEARGGVLFIDEAYNLGETMFGTFGKEAQDKLVSLMTEDAYRDSTVVILAGYTDDMRRMLTRNVGLAGRFESELQFPDWTPQDCAQKDSYDVSAD